MNIYGAINKFLRAGGSIIRIKVRFSVRSKLYEAYHIEPAILTQVVRKFYKYGRTEFSLSEFYPELAKGKRTPRKIGIRPESWLSLMLWFIKAIPYAIGKLTTLQRWLKIDDHNSIKRM
ncbi:hypothetical protein [Aeropyrum pernix]|nr:hypothetical protein [Aeropyrum pernix]